MKKKKKDTIVTKVSKKPVSKDTFVTKITKKLVKNQKNDDGSGSCHSRPGGGHC